MTMSRKELGPSKLSSTMSGIHTKAQEDVLACSQKQSHIPALEREAGCLRRSVYIKQVSRPTCSVAPARIGMEWPSMRERRTQFCVVQTVSQASRGTLAAGCLVVICAATREGTDPRPVTPRRQLNN